MKGPKVNKVIFLAIIIGIVILVILSVLSTQKSTNKIVCPDDFKNSEEKIKAFEDWVNKDFELKSEETFYADLQKARKEFYIQNNCQKALKRLKDYDSENLN